MMRELPVFYQFYIYLGFAATVVYCIEGIRSIFYYRKDQNYFALNFVGLCFTAALYSGLGWFGMAFKGVVPVPAIKHTLWLVGLLTNLFYFRAITNYLSISGQFVRWTQILLLIGIVLFASLGLHYWITDTSFLYVPHAGTPSSLFKELTGAYQTRPTGLMVSLSMLFVVLFLVSFIFLLRQIFRHTSGEYLLKVGVVITIASVLNEIFNATGVISSVSFMFLSKGIEILRISEYLKRKTYQHIASLQFQLTEVSKRAATAFITSGLVHDIKGPLTVVLAYIAKIKSSASKVKGSSSLGNDLLATQLSADLQLSADKLSRNIERIQQMITSYLDLLRNSRNPHHQKLRLDTLIQGALELSEPRIQSTGVPPVVYEPVPDVSLLGTKSQLEMVFANILNNAIDAVRGHDRPLVQIRFRQEGGVIVVCVTNSGVMPEDLLQQIQNGEAVTSKGDFGNGIGLRIVTELCRVHGAAIKIFNEEKSTHVEVSFPTLDSFQTVKAA